MDGEYATFHERRPGGIDCYANAHGRWRCFHGTQKDVHQEAGIDTGLRATMHPVHERMDASDALRGSEEGERRERRQLPQRDRVRVRAESSRATHARGDDALATQTTCCHQRRDIARDIEGVAQQAAMWCIDHPVRCWLLRVTRRMLT